MEKVACHPVLHKSLSASACELCPLAGVWSRREVGRKKPLTLRGDPVPCTITHTYGHSTPHHASACNLLFRSVKPQRKKKKKNQRFTGHCIFGICQDFDITSADMSRGSPCSSPACLGTVSCESHSSRVCSDCQHLRSRFLSIMYFYPLTGIN